jgi:hypothetical protein
MNFELDNARLTQDIFRSRHTSASVLLLLDVNVHSGK